MMLLVAASVSALAGGYGPPNSTLAASVGSPWLFGGRGEAWLADELSGELGGGGFGPSVEEFGFDVTLRWRPDALCLACDRRLLATVGFGVAAMVEPDLTLTGPWRTAVGPDLAATAVWWFSPAYGLSLTVRGGAGILLEGTEVAQMQPLPWGFGSLGLAF